MHSSGDMRPGQGKGKVRKTDGWKVGESSPQDVDEPQVESCAALPGEPRLKGKGGAGNSRRNQYKFVEVRRIEIGMRTLAGGV